MGSKRARHGDGLRVCRFAWIAGKRAPGFAGSVAANATDAPANEPALTILEALRTRSFWLLLLGIVVFFVFFLGMNDAFVSFMLDLGMSRTETAWYYALATGAGGLSKLVAGALGDRLHPKLTLLADHALLAVSALLLLALPQREALWAFLACYGLGIAARDVVYRCASSVREDLAAVGGAVPARAQ